MNVKNINTQAKTWYIKFLNKIYIKAFLPTYPKFDNNF